MKTISLNQNDRKIFINWILFQNDFLQFNFFLEDYFLWIEDSDG